MKRKTQHGAAISPAPAAQEAAMSVFPFPVATNEIAKAGQMAARRKFLFDGNRYALFPVHSRFGAIEWFVADAESLDPVTGLPEIIRQEPTAEKAVEGLL
jgi:hypothetical protein